MLLTELDTGEYIITYFHNDEKVCEKKVNNYTDGQKRADEWKHEENGNYAILTRILYNSNKTQNRWE